MHALRHEHFMFNGHRKGLGAEGHVATGHVVGHAVAQA